MSGGGLTSAARGLPPMQTIMGSPMPWEVPAQQQTVQQDLAPMALYQAYQAKPFDISTDMQGANTPPPAAPIAQSSNKFGGK